MLTQTKVRRLLTADPYNENVYHEATVSHYYRLIMTEILQ